MSIGQYNNKGKFIVFESNAIRLNNDVFPAQNINVALNASVQDSIDINGNLIGYVPNGPIQGSVSFSFDLTGLPPSYFNITGLSEEPTLIKFNTFVMYGYLQSLKYNVEPYKPITVDADFAFFHGIKYLNTYSQDYELANFSSKLKTYNGLSSYLITDVNNNLTPVSFTYSFNAERVPYTKVGFESPTRVALENVKAEMTVVGNNLDDYMSIRGNDRVFEGVLNELFKYESVDRMTLKINGKLVDQSFSIDSKSYGSTQLKLIQSLPKKRNVVSIPFIDNALLLTSTQNRVYTVPDFGVVCPSIIARNQVVDGGGTPGDIDEPSLPPEIDKKIYTWYLIKCEGMAGNIVSQTNKTASIFYDNENKSIYPTPLIYTLGPVGSNLSVYTDWRLVGMKENVEPISKSNLSDINIPNGSPSSFSVNNLLSYTYITTFVDVLESQDQNEYFLARLFDPRKESAGTPIGGVGTYSDPFVFHISPGKIASAPA